MTLAPKRCERCGFVRPMDDEWQQYCRDCIKEYDDMLRPSYQIYQRCCEIIRQRWLEKAPEHLRIPPHQP